MGGGWRSRFLEWTPPEVTLEEQPERLRSLSGSELTGARSLSGSAAMGERPSLCVPLPCAREEQGKDQLCFALTTVGRTIDLERWILGLKAPRTSPSVGH